MAKAKNDPASGVRWTDWLCAGHGTCLKGEPTISNHGSQGKSRILGIHVLKDMCLPREVFHAPRDAACGRKWLRAGQPAR
ncbi:MAG: hypothetical protein JRE64_17540 [Deltaproteobacteria bacterium]|nr:hypothetical protein [Deltaproteobacteria bacterium]